MEVEQKISNFITKRLEKFASFQDEEQNGSFSTSPKPFHPQRTFSTYQPAHQLQKPHEKSAFKDDQIHGNQEQFQKKVYGRSSSSVEWSGNDIVPNISNKEYGGSVSGPGGLNDGQKAWIDSPKRRQPVEKMQNLETAEFYRGQKNYDQRGLGGEAMEIRQFSPGAQYYPAEEQRKIRQNVESGKVAGFSRTHMYPTNEEGNGSPRSQNSFIGRSQGRNREGAPVGKDQEIRGAHFTGNMRYEIHGTTNDYRHQSKERYMDSIEAAKLHGGVLIIDSIEAAKLHGGVLIIDYSKK